MTSSTGAARTPPAQPTPPSQRPPHQAKWTQRVAPFVPIVVMAILAGATYWLLQSSLKPAAQPAAKQVGHTADYFGNDLSVTMLDDTGNVQYRLNARTLTHYEDDQNSVLTDPALRSFKPGSPIITATSKRGVVNSDASIVNLYDDAKVVRAPGPADPPMEADSSHFEVLVNDDTIRTEKPVKLTRGPSIATATQGMTYINTTRSAQLFGNVRGSIAAQQLNGGTR
ncbi:LPS export ABC transporter periplasmic protein LptC [Robbsia sp. KACC 23696]|uniref:LPS export ABC transporter periplasmic protein LptC n=1 Tax=Robbsia sp. KACC 23696 TaxID=3149231 RepID=UPI00325B427D